MGIHLYKFDRWNVFTYLLSRVLLQDVGATSKLDLHGL
jgi:hypothetical protein